MAAYNLEAGGLATVTAVLRSNFKAVSENGFTITSVDHGDIKGWKPTNSKYFFLSKILELVTDIELQSSMQCLQLG